MGKAILSVDPQNDFCPPDGALMVPDGVAVMRLLSLVMAFAYAHRIPNFLSGDCHPYDTVHFKIWPRHCVEGTWGAKFHPSLQVPDSAYIILKGMDPYADGYSPFDGACLQNGRSLEELLRSEGVDELWIGGLATDYCVKTAALDALKKGFKVCLMLDACRAVDEEKGKEAVKEMEDAGAAITNTVAFMKSFV